MNRHTRKTVLDLVDHNAEEYPDLVATWDGDDQLTWAQYRDRARAIALMLLDLGVGKGDVVGLHLPNRVEHVLADIGAVMAGAIPSSYYNTLAADQLAYVAGDSAATVVITDVVQLPLWLAIQDQLPKLRHVLVLDLEPDAEDDQPPWVHRFEHLMDLAKTGLEHRRGELDRARRQVDPDEPLTIVYTSGTTGAPKGTIITHTAALWVMEEVNRQLVEFLGGPVPAGWTTVSYLPLAHVAERLFSHYQALARTITVTYVRETSKLPHLLPQIRPKLFLGVPRVWERVYGAIRERASTSKNPIKRLLINRAISVAREVGALRLTGGFRDWRTRIRHGFMNRLVYRKLRATLGMDQVVLAVSGAASLPVEVKAFFAGVGITIIEVYGMTETCAMLAASPLDAPRLGSVGKALKGIELKIAPDGEVIARGPNITPGYLHRPDATQEAIDPSGWLHTGDIGVLDDEGYLRITGRKKELINTASGKTISPANVELALSSASDLIGSVYVHGDDKPCLVALVTLDSGWPQWCAARGIQVENLAEATSNGRVRLEVARSVGAGNAVLSRVEQVKNWALLQREWSSETGELTPTMKLKRTVIAKRYRDDIEALYDPLTADAWTDE
ncbi:AMP-dependent synthetase/ligase [Pseudonocardia acaciae]|uniref:AMP-dependent synthetase/ligase n=1 Tax=Pseudonocardia acaciae TaxID=551276 RepID=UPI0007E8DE03|nr:long-chain fatty acid--CoA ligase [Pseudonocardia acaciae]